MKVSEKTTAETALPLLGTTAMPLHGIRILDLTHVIAGPFATMMLAHMGADVVKVERPGIGEQLRNVPAFEGREGHPDYFNAVNLSKRGVVFDYKNPVDRAAVRELAREADVLIENFSPGTVDKLGIGWREMSSINPRLVYCSLSAYGQTGPYSGRSGMDTIIQAITGTAYVTGHADGPPVMIGAPLADVISGMLAAYSVVSALHGVKEGGCGRHIDLSMQAAMLYALGPRIAEYLQAGKVTQRMGSENPLRVPSNIYRAGDGRYAKIHCSNDRRWAALCRIMDKPEWIDDARFTTMEQRRTHRADVNAMVAARFAEKPLDDWLPLFIAHDFPMAPVNDYAQALSDPQVQHRDQLVSLDHELDGPIRAVGPPWLIDGAKVPVTPPPLLGQHTSEVLGDWLGWDEGRIKCFTRERLCKKADKS